MEDSRSSMSKQKSNVSLYTRTTNRSDTFVSEDLDRIDGLSISMIVREKTDFTDLDEIDPGEYAKNLLAETPRSPARLGHSPRRKNHKEILNMGYEQTRDSGVYKRTRRLFRIPQPRGLAKWPAGFELSGTKLCELDKAMFDKENVEELDVENGESNNVLPPLSLNTARTSVFPARVRVSPFFSSDYGMRRQRTDTFSGYRNRSSVKDNLELERDLEEKVRRHVYACQVLGNARRGSPAVQSFTALREAMSPSRRRQFPVIASPFYITQSPREMMRMNTSLSSDKAPIDTKSTRRQPLTLVIQTREGGRQKLTREFTRDPLPEICGRTLIAGSGYDI